MPLYVTLAIAVAFFSILASSNGPIEEKMAKTFRRALLFVWLPLMAHQFVLAVTLVEEIDRTIDIITSSTYEDNPTEQEKVLSKIFLVSMISPFLHVVALWIFPRLITRVISTATSSDKN
ncbi:MAG: hypothetical protein OYG31_00555 [Candidatus Kaiserbacteria bacterium]|nr:hypothetical protein [Candidatus Kaiserbacteria bacterium]